MKKHTMSAKKIAMTALLAALTVAGSAIRVTLPLDIAGTTSFHLGNIICALAGILLGPIYGGLAAGLGSAVYDMLNPMYISECWITFIMKGTYGLMAGLIAWSGGRKPWNTTVRCSYLKALLATVVGALAYAVLYLAKSYFYSGLLLNGLTSDAAMVTVIGKLPATIFNAVIAIIAAPTMAFATSVALEDAHIKLN